MAAIINTVFPSFAAVGNYSGVNSGVRSAGIVQNIEQRDTIINLERQGKLGLTQFGLIKLPREVLILQDERDAKVRATRNGDQVTSSSKSDFDEGRTLDRVEDAENIEHRVEAIKARQERSERNNNGVQAKAENAQQAQAKAAEIDNRDPRTRAPAPPAETRRTEEFAGLAAQRGTEARSEGAAPAKKREETRANRPTLAGPPSDVYAAVQEAVAAYVSSGNEQQGLDVLA